MTQIFSRSLLALTLCAVWGVQPVASFAETADGGDAGAYLAAKSAAMNNDYREGLYWFDRALKGDPDNQTLLEGAVVSYLGAGDVELAAKAAQKLTKLGGRNIAANIALLARDAKAEDYKAILAAPAERGIGNLLDKLVRAWAEFGDGRMSEATAAFDEISKTDGLKAFGLYHKALALAAVGDFEAADGILSGRTSGPLVINRRGVIAHLQILSQLEKFDDALALMDRSFGVEQEPELTQLRADLTAHKALPFTAVANARDGIAEVFFTLAAALNGEAEDGYTLLYARVAAYLNPALTESVLMSASLLQRQGQQQLAGEAYASIPPQNPAYFSAEIGRADTLYALGKKDESLAALKALAASYSELSVVQMAYGDALRREDKFQDSVNAYDAAIALIPKPEARHWAVFYSRGVSNERAGHWPQAEADLRKSLELNPEQPQVLNYLGYSFVDRGENLDEALKLIERAVAARPDSGYIIDSLAWAYFRLGRYQDAVEPMEKASLLEPVDPIVTDHLGDVYWAAGRQLEARFQWRRALSFSPEEKDAVRIRRKLEIGLDAVLKEEGAKPLEAVKAGANGN
jgi:Flp pilus assembly protein TadD